MIKKENYINIQGWMKTDLGLSGNELLVYSIIFGFSQDGESQYKNGVKYISEWIGCSYPTALSILKKLHEKGLIEKIDVVNEKGKFVNYRILNNLTTPIKNFNNPPIKNFNTEIKDIIDNIKSNIKPAIEKWLQYKKERKESYKPTGLRDCIKKLETLSGNNGDLAMEIVEQSTANGYSGLFPLKSQQQKQEQSERKFLIEPFKFFIDDDEKNCPGYADLVKQLPESEWYKIGDWITKKFYGQEIGLSTIRTILTKAIQNKGGIQ